MSKQSEWQKRMVEQGRCKICGKPVSATNKQFCELHRLQMAAFKKKYRNKKKGN